MCVIAVIQAGATMPSKAEFHDCWDRNSDGAGFAYRYQNKVHWVKGLMNFKSFWKAFREMPDEARQGDVIVHFRIATHSVKDGGNTHPFLVCRDSAAMRETVGETDTYVLFHNGVIGTPHDPLMSDTMVFNKDVVAPYLGMFTTEEDNSTLMKLLIGSNKFVLFSHDDLVLLGDWQLEGKVYWSNLNHRTYARTSFPQRSGHDDYSDYYDWWSSRSREPYHKASEPQNTRDVLKLCCNCKHNGPHTKITVSTKEQIDICQPCWDKIGRKPNFEPKPEVGASACNNGKSCSLCQHTRKSATDHPCNCCYRLPAHPFWEPVIPATKLVGAPAAVAPSAEPEPSVEPDRDMPVDIRVCHNCKYVHVNSLSTPCSKCNMATRSEWAPPGSDDKPKQEPSADKSKV